MRCLVLLLALLAPPAWAGNTVVVIRHAAAGGFSQNSRNFNGTSDRLDLGCSSGGNGVSNDIGYSVCLWFRLETDTATDRAIYNEWDNGNTTQGAQMTIDATEHLYCQYRWGSTCTGPDSANCQQSTGTTTLSLNTWYYGCCTAGGTAGNLQTWLNGATEGPAKSLSTASANTVERCNAGALVRSSGPTVSIFFDGDIAHVQAWSAEINSTVINASMVAPGCSTTNLAHYWPIKGDSPELDAFGTYDGTVLTGTTITAAQPSSVTSVCP